MTAQASKPAPRHAPDGVACVAVWAASPEETQRRAAQLEQAAQAWAVALRVLPMDETGAATQPGSTSADAPHVLWLSTAVPVVNAAAVLHAWRAHHAVAVVLEGPLPAGAAWACLLGEGDVLMSSDAELLRWTAARSGGAPRKEGAAPALGDVWRHVREQLWPCAPGSLGHGAGPSACLRQLPTPGEASKKIPSLGLNWLDTPHASGWLQAAPGQNDWANENPGPAWLTHVAATAVALAKGFVTADAVTLGLSMGENGAGELPRLSWSAVARLSSVVDVVQAVVGSGLPPAPSLYAIVDTAERLATCAANGTRVVQLRAKLPPVVDGARASALRKEIQACIKAAHAAQACLFINDHRQAVLDLGAGGLHMGQEDLLALTEMQRAALRQPRLPTADGRLRAVDWAQAGDKAVDGALQMLQLGISSHSVWELARARALSPDYVACGPVWATTTKDMPWHPQGLHNLRWWVANAGCPVVAIGGILTEQHIHQAAATGAAAVCVVRGLGEDPAQTLPAMQQALEQGHASERLPAPALPQPSLTSGFGVSDVRAESVN